MFIKITKITLAAFLIASLTGVFFLNLRNNLYAKDGSRIGTIGSVDNSTNEAIVNTENGKSLNIGDRIYIRIGGNPVIMKVTFPMMTTAKCSVEKKYVKQTGLIVKGLPVYKYENGIENASVENNGNAAIIEMINLPKGLRGEFGGSASEFSEGLAKVYGAKPSGTGEGMCYGFVDKKGKLVIPDRYKYDFDFDEGEGFIEGVAQVFSKKDRFHFINKKGDKIFSLEGYFSNGQFSGGLAWVSVKTGNSEKYGYINKEGKIAIEAQFDSAENFSKGYAKVKKDGREFYINTEGKAITGTPDEIKNEQTESFAISEQKDKMYIVNKDGKNIIEIHYKSAGDFSENLAAVYKDGKWGYIDTAGKEVIPCQFEGSEYESNQHKFSEGLAIVKKNNMYGFIDKSGRIVIPAEYDYAGFFKEGAAFVGYKGKNGFILNPLNEK